MKKKNNINKAIIFAFVTAAIYMLCKHLFADSEESRKPLSSEDVLNNQDISEWLKEQYVVHTLSGKELSDWFRQEKKPESQMYLLQLKEEWISAKEIDADNFDFSSYVLQCVIDRKNDTILKARLINFVEMSPELQKRLDEGNGIIEIYEEEKKP